MASVKRGRQQGFVLPLTLVVVAILTVLAMGLNRMGSAEIEAVHLVKQQWENELAIRNALQAILYPLLVGNLEPRRVRDADRVLPTDGTPIIRSPIEIRIQDVAGLISLGDYDQKVFQRVLAKLTEKAAAGRMAAVLGDWVDEDLFQRYRGMETAHYAAAGMARTPRNGPLRSLDELIELPGMTFGLFNGENHRGEKPGLRDLVIAGGVGWFNAASAPAILLSAKLGLEDKQVAPLVAAREAGDWRLFKSLLGNHRGGNNGLPWDLPSNQFRLILRADSGHRARVLIEVTATAHEPYRILAWQYPDYARF